MELYAEALEVLYHRQDHGLILVVLGEAERLEIRQTADVVDIALNIAFHLKSAVPVLKREHRAPVEPEVGVQHLVIEEIGYLLVLEILLRGEEQLHDLHCALVRDVELAVGVGVLAAVYGRTAEGVVRVLLVEPVVLVEDGYAFCFDGRNGVEQIPHYLKVVVHLTAAAHYIADVLVLPAVAGAARELLLLENVDVFALHLTVANEIARSSQCSKTASYNIRGLIVNARRLLRSCKCFVVTA